MEDNLSFYANLLYKYLSHQCISQKNGDSEADSLVADRMGKREAGDDESYDRDMKTNYYESKGSYTIDLVGQRRLVRRTRSVKDHLNLPDAVESSILAFINHSESVAVLITQPESHTVYETTFCCVI